MRTLTEQEQADIARAAIASTEQELDTIGEAYSEKYLKLLKEFEADQHNIHISEELAIHDAIIDLLATIAALRFNDYLHTRPLE